MDIADVTSRLKRRARELGFSLVGVCPAVSPPGVPHFEAWLAAGYAGQMSYLPARRDAYTKPQNVLDGARSIVMMAMDYRTANPVAPPPGRGRVSRYAWGDADYHDVIRARLNLLAGLLLDWVPAARVRGVVDSAPLLEREFAQLAGLGWIGKNTLLINRGRGSWFFLAALLTDVELVCDQPHESDHCGTCRACLEACPTGAFPQPYVLDATRCISYLTIELRDAVPPELRAGMGDWLFGCDVCQDVCPWNSRAPLGSEPSFAPRDDSNPLDLIRLFELDDAGFRQRFRHTPLCRPRRRGLLRNAAIVLGNRPTPTALTALVRGLHDVEPLVRGACAWALARYALPEAAQALRCRMETETDAGVRSEISAALAERVDRSSAPPSQSFA